MSTEPETCADCGKKIRRGLNGHWASHERPGQVYTCRALIRGGRMLSADYHYVEGEQQHRWAVPEVSP